MAYYPRRRRRRYGRRFYGRARRSVRYVTRYVRSGGRRARAGFMNLRPMHRHMLAGAVIMLVVFLMMPKARNWLLTTWFKLGLPAPKAGA